MRTLGWVVAVAGVFAQVATFSMFYRYVWSTHSADWDDADWEDPRWDNTYLDSERPDEMPANLDY